MSKIRNKIRERQSSYTSMKAAFYNDDGAIDLASIMVGIIVIGLIGGVIAATVFAVIPWSQDNAAQHQLESIHTAQNAYYGLSSDPSRPLAAGQQRNSFTNSVGLAASGLLTTGTTYCTVPTNGGKDYEAFARSSSGTIFKASNSNKTAAPFVGTLPNDVTTGDCSFISAGSTGTGSGSEPSYIDPTPTKTIMTYRCDAGTSGSFPFKDVIQGTFTMEGSNGTKIETSHANQVYMPSLGMVAGVTYKITFDGTYSSFNQGGSDLAKCIRSLDHWGMDTGVVSATSGMGEAINLTSVPEHIPTTVTNLSYFFNNASKINDPNISKWDVSKVTTFQNTFYGTTVFNQPLNDWKMSSATNLRAMFMSSAYNQPVDKWDVSNVTNMFYVFMNNNKFNQPLNDWDVSNVTSMNGMLSSAAFNQPLDKWDVSNVTDMKEMFKQAAKFNQNIGMWKPAKVTDVQMMFSYATDFRQDLSSWRFNVRPNNFAFAPTGFPAAYLPTF